MFSADLSGRTAIVTGAASGIGLAATELLLRCGAAVALNYLPDDQRGPAAVQRLQAEGHRVVGAPGDVSDAGGARGMTLSSIEALGRLDILLNNAGTPASVEPVDFNDLELLTEAFWATILSTNLMGPFRCAHAAVPALQDAGGVIVNTASVAGLGRRGSSIAYGASKAGLVNLTQNLARALAPKVRVNAVAPGLVDSTWTAPWPAEFKDRIVNRTLDRRMATPDDIAEAMLFLAVARHVNGHTLVVDGGWD